MGNTTGIAWADKTHNEWISCTKVSEGCDHCYAERQNHFYKWNGGTWGKGAPRKRTGLANRQKPYKWNRDAQKLGIRYRVFTASLSDVFDGEVDDEWRMDLFDTISNTPYLDWMVLTKRIQNAKRMIAYATQRKTDEWLAEHPNVWLGVSAEDQRRWDERVPVLREIPAKVRFVSIEPMLACVNPFWDFYGGQPPSWGYPTDIHWIIAGGESGPGCRGLNIDWLYLLRDTCKDAGVAFFMKQLGGHPDKRDKLEDLPEDLRIRQFPVVNS